MVHSDDSDGTFMSILVGAELSPHWPSISISFLVTLLF